MSETVSMLRRHFLAALGMSLAFASGAAAQAPLQELSVNGKNRYQNCLALSAQNPQEAYRQAQAWRAKGGGGAAADHCSALALVGLKRYGEAAGRLAALAGNRSLATAMRAQLYDQAGNAWLLAGAGASAENDFSSALALSPKDADILADRARARAMRKAWTLAEGDLSAALASDPARADLYVLRASARHAVGKKIDAAADIDRALILYPGYPDALLERGEMKFTDGETAGARDDWLKVVTGAPKSAAAASARRDLQAMGINLPMPQR